MGASDVCFEMSRYLYGKEKELPGEQYRFLQEIVETFRLPLSQAKQLWHPVLQRERLKQLAQLEKDIELDIRVIADQVLKIAAKRKSTYE